MNLSLYLQHLNCIRFSFLSFVKCIDVGKCPYSGGIVDLHLCQQFSINAEVAKAAPLVVDDAVALAGHGDKPWALIVIWPL